MSNSVYRNNESARRARPGRKPKGPRVRIQIVEKDSVGTIESYCFTVKIPFTTAMRLIQEAFQGYVKERF